MTNSVLSRGGLSSGECGKQSLTMISAFWTAVACLFTLLMPELACAGGPFSTGATAAQTNILTILTPIAVIAVMALGVAAWFNKISWGWCVGGVVGIVLVFGAPQIVAWVRGMFGV
jgi:type IV secretion system protein VirB2